MARVVEDANRKKKWQKKKFCHNGTCIDKLKNNIDCECSEQNMATVKKN